MSGFEVVGVVLGVLPLLVEGLKTYQNGLKTASNMVNYEETIGGLVSRFVYCSSIYLHSTERLLQPLMLEDHEIKALVDDPNGPSWKNPGLAYQLQERLGHDHVLFLEVTTKLHARLIKFATKLAMDPNNGFKPKWMNEQETSQSNFRRKFFDRSNRTWKGLKIGWQNGNLYQALQKIEADLSRLSNLVDSNERELPARQARKRIGNVRMWQNIRNAAKSVHAVLSTHLQCPQGHHHSASLRLETRSIAEPASVRFGIILVSHGNSPGRLWHELEVEPKETAFQASSTVLAVSEPPVSPMSSDDPFKVTFITTAPDYTTNYKPSIKATAAATGPEIKNLCAWQQNPQPMKPDSLGFVEHQCWRHHFFKDKVKDGKLSYLTMLSMRDCVTDRVSSQLASSIFVGGLSTREKYHFATVLASSVLQLADTPWLPHTALELNDIFLMDLKHRSMTAANPYVQRSFPSATGLRTKPSCPAVDNELVFALGVVLIELAYQAPLSFFRQDTDLDNGREHAYTDFQVASRLVHDLDDMEGSKYAKVVRRCVRCNFEARECSLDDMDFQAQFYNGVVQPLQELKEALE